MSCILAVAHVLGWAGRLMPLQHGLGVCCFAALVGVAALEADQVVAIEHTSPIQVPAQQFGRAQGAILHRLQKKTRVCVEA